MLKVITVMFFGSNDAKAVAEASDKLHTDPNSGVTLLSHAACEEQGLGLAQAQYRMIGISIADVVDHHALNNAANVLQGTGAVVHMATASQIALGDAVNHMAAHPVQPHIQPQSK